MKIHSVQLQTQALAAIRSFYHGLLDLEFREKPGESLQVDIGNSALTFSENPGFQGIYHLAFNIPCNQIELAKNWLERRRIPLIPGFKGEPIIEFPNWHARSVYFFDPAGNIVEFIARRDLQNDCTQAFGPEAFLEISEVGIVTEAVDRFRETAAERYGVLDFDKQPALPAFAALGDDHGLFIVVPKGRHWVFTDVPATINPLEVRFENERGEQFTYAE